MMNESMQRIEQDILEARRGGFVFVEVCIKDLGVVMRKVEELKAEAEGEEERAQMFYVDGYRAGVKDAAKRLKEYSITIPIDIWQGPKRELVKMFALRAAARIELLPTEVKDE